MGSLTIHCPIRTEFTVPCIPRAHEGLHYLVRGLLYARLL